MTREEAKKYLKSADTTVGKKIKTRTAEALEMAIQALEQEPKIGYWITKDGKEQGYDIGGVKTWYIQILCSECGFIKTAIEGHTGRYKYCPQCGLKMQKVEK